MKKATLLYKKCRQSILDLHDDCAKVETGRLAFRVTSSKSPRYTIKNLITALGKQGLETLRGRIPPTASRTLKVFEVDNDGGG